MVILKKKLYGNDISQDVNNNINEIEKIMKKYDSLVDLMGVF